MMEIIIVQTILLPILGHLAKVIPKSLFKNFKNVICMGQLIWPNLSKQTKYRILLCFVLLILVRIFGLLTPLLSQFAADKLLLSMSNSKNNDNFPYVVISFSILVAFGQRLTEICHSLLWIGVEQDSTKLINEHFVEHLYNLDMKWHLNHKPGNILKIMEVGSTSWSSIIEHLLFCLLPNVLDILIAFIHLQAIFNSWLIFGIVIQLILLVLITQALMDWRRNLLIDCHKRDKITSKVLIDTLLNIENVKCFNGESYEKERIMTLFKDFQVSEKKAEFTRIWLDFTQSLIFHSSLLYGSLFTGYLIYSENLGFGYYLLFLTYMGQIRGLLKYFFEYLKTINLGLVQLDSLTDTMEMKPPELNSHDISDLPFPSVDGNLAIQFENVKFSFNNESEVLHGISFAISAGTCVGITGPTGHGKSTILKLLLRLWNPDSGTIKINGRLIEKYSLHHIRRLISIVPQDTILFNDTIGSNITYGIEDSEQDDVDFAVDKAVLWKDVMSLPQRYDTPVGERGLCLSGGQRLRVCIARCIYRKSKIVLLDEPTCSLDKSTEAKIIQNINEILKDKTRIIISHNLNVISNCDQILVLNGGEIVESGKHLELLNKENGFYRKMWNCQRQGQHLVQDNGHGQTRFF